MSDSIIKPFKIDELFEKRVEELDGQRLFEIRLFVEGRVFEFQSKMKDAIENLSIDEAKSWKYVADQMGYSGHRAARDWYIAFLKRLHQQEREERNRDRSRKTARRKKIRERRQEFEAALDELPAVASLVDEVEWVSCHQVMTRNQQTWAKEMGEKEVPLTVEDIRDCKLPCPSQRAVAMLGNYKDRPADFYKQYQSTLTKKEESLSLADDPLEQEVMADAKKTARQIEEMISALVEGSAA